MYLFKFYILNTTNILKLYDFYNISYYVKKYFAFKKNLSTNYKHVQGVSQKSDDLFPITFVQLYHIWNIFN